jgi:hypothetical protein
MAGNVPIFTPPGTQADLVAGCAAHLTHRGALVAGFQLDRGYSLDDYDEHAGRNGLECVGRWSTWSGEAFSAGGDYAVSLHRATS